MRAFTLTVKTGLNLVCLIDASSKIHSTILLMSITVIAIGCKAAIKECKDYESIEQ